MQNLTKNQKKVARELIQKGLQIECAECLEKVESLLSKSKEDKLSSHEIYLKLYQMMEKFDKHIARRYDGLGGSRYFMTVFGLYMDDVLSIDDLGDFEEDVRNEIIKLRGVL